MGYLVVAYTVLLVYGSLYPFAWVDPAVPVFAFLGAGWPAHPDKVDVIQNVLVYMPFGMAAVAWMHGFLRFWPALVLAVTTGTGLSLAVEILQNFIPGRDPSVVDVAMNFVGTIFGGLLAALLSRETSSGMKMLVLRDDWFHAGALSNAGLVTLGLWFLSQTSPFVPWPDLAHARDGFFLLLNMLLSPQYLSMSTLLSNTFYFTALGLLTSVLGRTGKPVMTLFRIVLALVLIGKLFVVGRHLTAEAVLAAGAAMILLMPLCRMTAVRKAYLGIALITAGFIVYELKPRMGWPSGEFNWLPFWGQMRSIAGLENILEFLWPFMAIGYFSHRIAPPARRGGIAVCGSMAVVGLLFFLEWHQQTIPGRFGDITQVILGFSGWLVPWCTGDRLMRTRTKSALSS